MVALNDPAAEPLEAELTRLDEMIAALKEAKKEMKKRRKNAPKVP
jgi:hypothetical protein